MMRFGLFLISLTWILLGLFSCSSKVNSDLKIATAANLQYVMPVLVKEFEKETGTTCEIILGSSGKLHAQIVQGAPFHVFVSADMKYPKDLFEKGMATNKPFHYANGKLVLWKTTMDKMNSRDLWSPEIHHIAIANPDLAPYGRAAIEYLETQGNISEIQSKLVYGESVLQTNQFVFTGAAEVGITALSTLRSMPITEKEAYWEEIDSKLYSQIGQGAIGIANNGQEQNIESFLRFLDSKQAKEILISFGYAIPNE